VGWVISFWVYLVGKWSTMRSKMVEGGEWRVFWGCVWEAQRARRAGGPRVGGWGRPITWNCWTRQIWSLTSLYMVIRSLYAVVNSMYGPILEDKGNRRAPQRKFKRWGKNYYQQAAWILRWLYVLNVGVNKPFWGPNLIDWVGYVKDGRIEWTPLR
jgi:hypothetical protein